MQPERGLVRQIAWSEVFPSLRLFRVVRIALKSKVLLLATAGFLTTLTGWWAAGLAYSGSSDPLIAELRAGLSRCPWTAAGSEAAPQSGQNERATPAPTGQNAAQRDSQEFPRPQIGLDTNGQLADAFVGPWQILSAPFRQMFRRDCSWVAFAYALTCGIWAAAVWGFFGGAIARIAVMDFGREEAVSMGGALAFASKKWWELFRAPLYAFVGVAIVCLGPFFAGLLLRLDFGLFIASLGWPLVLVAAGLLVALLVGLSLGWPLAWPTIAAEGNDGFDAMSRMFSYVYDRPLKLFALIAFAAGLGVISWTVLQFLSEGMIELSWWAVSWGSGADRAAALSQGAAELSGIGRAGLSLIHFWQGCVRALVDGFAYGYFVAASSGIYLLLRREVDAQEFDEIWLPDEPQAHTLPPLTTDAAGVPIVAEVPSPPSPSSEDGQSSASPAE